MATIITQRVLETPAVGVAARVSAIADRRDAWAGSWGGSWANAWSQMLNASDRGLTERIAASAAGGQTRRITQVPAAGQTRRISETPAANTTKRIS